MDSGAAVAAVREYLREADTGYPTDGLVADRFDAGWSVYQPGFTGDPAGFLIGDSGRIQPVPVSLATQTAQQRFAEQEQALAYQSTQADARAFIEEFKAGFDAAAAASGGHAVSTFVVDDADPATTRRDDQIAQQASAMIEPIVQQLAALGPPGWQQFSAVFALTVNAGSAQLRFATTHGFEDVQVPPEVMDLVHRQREVSAAMSAGPWWRLMLTLTNQAQLEVSYDYGDEPFPDDQLQPAQNYRDDVAAHPRPLPVWLAGYLAGPAAQGRDPAKAAADAAADQAASRVSVETEDVEPLSDTWARWSVLAAVYVGARSQWGPRISPGLAWYESAVRSGSSLFVLPGDRAVLSGGRWNSPLLVAAYQQGQPLPDLFTGAPAWVNDSVLNTRNRNGLLSFCFWWDQGRWWRAGTDTFDELDDPLPVIWTPQETVAAMVAVVGPGVEQACADLLAAAGDHQATREQVAAVLSQFRDPDVDGGINQLSIAGLAG